MQVVMRYEKESEFTSLNVPEGKELDDFLNKDYEERRRNAAPDEVVERKTLQEVIDELFDPERGEVGNNHIRRNERKQRRHTTVFTGMSEEHEDDFLGAYTSFDENGLRIYKNKNGKYKQQSIKKNMPSDGSRFKGPFEALAEKEDQEKLLSAVNDLKEKQIGLLDRFFFEEDRVKDIAEDEKVSESAITQRKGTILNKLGKNPKLKNLNFTGLTR